MSEIQAANSAQVTSFLSQNGGVAVVDCYATWCPPCKFIAPIAHALSQSAGVGLVKVNVDAAPELSNGYNIQCMPTFLLIKGTWNNVVERIEGADE